MTEPMKTEGTILREKLGDKYINEQAIRYAVYNAMREHAAQQVAAERERIKNGIYKVFGDSVVEEWSSSRIRKEILEKLIDSL